jgi:hypothetical protein
MILEQPKAQDSSNLSSTQIVIPVTSLETLVAGILGLPGEAETPEVVEILELQKVG